MAKLISCKDCNSEMSKNAKVCPKCGAPAPTRTSKFAWFMAMVFGLIFYSYFTSDSTRNATPSVANQIAEIKMGELFKTSKFEIVIDKVSLRNRVGSQFFESTPSEGGIYVAIEWHYTNITDKPISSYSQPSITLRNPSGTAFNRDVSASGSFATMLDLDSKVVSDLNPGITVKDADVFEVSKTMYDPASWKLHVDADNNYLVSLQ